MGDPTYQSTKVLSRPIPAPLSAFSTSPSTARSSIFSSTNSVFSTSPTSPPLPLTPEKRKHERATHQAKVGSKRRRVMGRPRNAWTPTRLRKLVRLYLMTNLEHTAIAKVLEEKGFNPKKRDIQKQLEFMLQPRPYQIRDEPHAMKSRLRILKDCRALRRSRGEARHPHVEPKFPSKTNTEKFSVQEDGQGSELVPGSNNEIGWSWLYGDPKLDQDASSQSLRHLAASGTRRIEENPREISDSGTVPLSVLPYSNSTLEIGLFQFDETQASRQSNANNLSFGIEDEKSTSHLAFCSVSNVSFTSVKYDLGSCKAKNLPDTSDHCAINYDLAVNYPEAQATDPESLVAPSLRMPDLLVPPKSNPSGSKFNLEPGRTNQGNLGFNHRVAQPTSELDTHQIYQEAYLNDKPDVESRLNAGGQPPRASALSIASLKKKLPPGYSQSDAEDIHSLMERLTISGCSTSFSSSARTSEISSQKSSRSSQRHSEILRSLSTIDDQPIALVKVKASVALPGVFPRYCEKQMNHNLGSCRSDNLLCEHTSSGSHRFFVSYLDGGKVLYRRYASRHIHEVDSFGNSILHIAAALDFRIQYIVKLIEEGANINVTNAAGETFLHLLYTPTCPDEVCLLLENLSSRGFNFAQHDQHGQTSLHLLTRPWLPQQYLIKVIRKMYSLIFDLPNSRDNLGFTLLSQAKHVGKHLLGFDPDQELASCPLLSLVGERQGPVSHPQNAEPSTVFTVDGTQCIRCYENQVPIHTINDLPPYAHHADLLKTIVRAGYEPWFEDSKGRNGIHCLAEVAFDLGPANEAKSTKDEKHENVNTLRERYLEGLLKAGVNPNNYDKEGITPLMAFIMQARNNENDGVTTRILSNLVNATADIHRRNRQGETALHLAVKLGRRAATKFLLQKRANVHARDKEGCGILEVAMKASRKAGRDEKAYAQILLCMSLVMRAGAVSSPTIMQEWESRSIKASSMSVMSWI